MSDYYSNYSLYNNRFATELNRVADTASEIEKTQGKEAAKNYRHNYTKNLGIATAAGVIGSTLPALPGAFLAFLASYPLLATGINTGLTVSGLYNLASDNGIKKTYNLFKDGNYGKALLSGTGDALDLTGTFQTVKLAKNLLNPAYRAAHTYVNISPMGYDLPFYRARKLVKGWLTNTKANINKPNWGNQIEVERGYLFLKNTSDAPIENLLAVSKLARIDAWRKYLRLPEPYGIYIKNPDGSFKYNLPKINNMLKGRFTPLLRTVLDKDGIPIRVFPNGLDYVTGAGGGLTKNISFLEDNLTGTLHIEDLWDITPFSRTTNKFGDYFKKYYANVLTPTFNKWYTTGYKSGLYKSKFGYNFLGGKYLNKMRYNNYFDNSFTNLLNRKLSNFEIGPLVGGKPFLMKTDIPFKYTVPDWRMLLDLSRWY